MSAQSPSATPRIALALGGGSARGLAHILMLEALDELGIKPAIIAGTSMGSICGAAYAAGLSAAQVRAEFEALLGNRATFLKHFAGKLREGFSTLWSVRNPTIVDNVTLFEMLLPDAMHCDFAALKIPFLAIATDYYGIEQVVLGRGPLIPALAASCSLPGLARPVVLEGRMLIDGGYVNPVPYDVVMDRANITVAVDVTGEPQGGRPGVKIPGTLDLLTGATQILFHSVTREKLKSLAPDIFIRPPVGGFAAMDYFKIGEILAAAQPAKDELKRKLSQRLDAAA
ncbi:MAG: patatin-like phospholipase family protein [Hyphomicrobiaceae bacterium]|nr:MAG: patatin-like phospholipase family protein [Hyphomicrobiaceae bacterium]